jgi:hypothetical protein
MPTIHDPDATQKFINDVQNGHFASIDSVDAAGQSRILDYFVKLLDFHASKYRYESVPVRFHPCFFHLPRTEKFFLQLFSSLELSLRPQIDEVFQHCCAFVSDYIGPREDVLVMHRLINKLKERFPHLSEMHDKALVSITTEVFRPTIGEFLNQHESAVRHLQNAFPAVYELFVAPFEATPFRDRKLFNFYCNPWIYQLIMDYLAYHARLASPEIARERLERPLQCFEGSLQTIRVRTSTESWRELTQKAHKLRNHSTKLEVFAIACAGLLGEIKTAAQFLETQCDPKDTLIFLPERSGDGKNCDLFYNSVSFHFVFN